MAMKVVLEEKGYEVISASTGKEGLNKTNSHAHLYQRKIGFDFKLRG